MGHSHAMGSYFPLAFEIFPRILSHSLAPYVPKNETMNLQIGKLLTRLSLILAFLLVCSCMTPAMREITARNNGAKFWIWTTANAVKQIEYHGPVDSQNRANGIGTYAVKDDFYGGNHFEATGLFGNGQPEGSHHFRTKAPVIEGSHHYANGQHTGMTKTRNDMPLHLANVATAGLTALATSRNSSQGRDIGSVGVGTTDITANYPEGFAYNVTTYVGQYQSDRYSFATIYGITTKAVAEQNLEAGRAVYGGPDKGIRRGWFYIEPVRVTKGSKVRVGIVGIR
jgi:hypothetical protein